MTERFLGLDADHMPVFLADAPGFDVETEIAVQRTGGRLSGGVGDDFFGGYIVGRGNAGFGNPERESGRFLY